MLLPYEALPSVEEAICETAKRIGTFIQQRLEESADALILVGSLAYGKNYAVRAASDIDLLVVMEPKQVSLLPEEVGGEEGDWRQVVLRYFQDNRIQTLSLRSLVERVKVEYHLWNKEYQYQATRLETTRVLRGTMSSKSTSGIHLDFSGQQRDVERWTKPLPIGYLQEYPVFRVVEKHFVPYEPLVNLIMAPEILFAKDQQLEHNIDWMWTEVVKRLVQENPGALDLSKTSVLKSQPGHWALPKEVRESIQDRTKFELSKLGALYTEGHK